MKIIEEMINLPNLKKRFISAVFLVPFAIAAVLLGGTIFNLVIISAVIIMSYELTTLLDKYTGADKKKWTIISFLYVLIPTTSLIFLRNLGQGPDIVVYILFLVWATDITAYFVGKNFGGPKLAPKISPNKTISGALGGLGGTLIISILTFFITDNISFFSFVFLSLFLSMSSQIGDLFESYMKRKFGVKDSGNLIPGHGGLLDRIDGLLFVAPIAAIIFGLLLKNIF